PGVSTLSLALAGVWPGPGAASMVEADASGGDVAAWWHLPPWPGAVDLAASSRSGQDHDRPDLATATQVLPGGTRVCVAPASADLLAVADLAVLVCSGDLAQLKRVKESAGMLFRAGPHVGLAVVGGRGSETEISEAVGLPVWAHLPRDAKAARFLTGQGDAAR